MRWGYIYGRLFQDMPLPSLSACACGEAKKGDFLGYIYGAYVNGRENEPVIADSSAKRSFDWMGL